MVKYTGINHLALATADLPSTIRFWRDLLGLRMVAGLGRPGYRQYFFELSDRDMILFFEWPDVEPLPDRDAGVPVTGPFAFDHVSLEVSSDEDLWELKDKLTAADIWVSEVVDHGFVHSLYTFDPNNVALELSARVPEVDLRATPILVDSDPCVEARQGPEPVAGVWPTVTRPTPESERTLYDGEADTVTRALRKVTQP